MATAKSETTPGTSSISSSSSTSAVTSISTTTVIIFCRHPGCRLQVSNVVLAKILYASPAWWGFANSSDKQRLEAFRHSTLLSKLAALDLPTPVYNWLVNFFESHSHHTVFNGNVSRTRSITASIIQGSSVGPAAYTVTTADLKPLNPDNTFFKFADDAYLVIPATKASTIASEIDNIVAWAADNNLSPNKSKSTVVLFRDNRRGKLKTLPLPLPDITQETSLKILGITFSNNLSASDHILNVVSESAKTL